MIQTILEIALAVGVASVAGFLIISNVLVRLKNRELFIKAAQAEVDRTTVYQQAQEIFKAEYEKSASNDGFLKFMSTSREWAFEYIEEVQKDLYELRDYFHNTGSSPKTVAQAQELNKLILKVLSHLPEEGKK